MKEEKREIIESAFKCVAQISQLDELQTVILREIIEVNLEIINMGNFELIKNNKVNKESRDIGLSQLSNQIHRFQINNVELQIIPDLHEVLLNYFIIAYLSLTDKKNL